MHNKHLVLAHSIHSHNINTHFVELALAYTHYHQRLYNYNPSFRKNGSKDEWKKIAYKTGTQKVEKNKQQNTKHTKKNCGAYLSCSQKLDGDVDLSK